jgi:hypothetical protein
MSDNPETRLRCGSLPSWGELGDDLQPYTAAAFSRVVGPRRFGQCAMRDSSWRVASVVSEAGGAYSSGMPALRRPSRR